MRRMPCALAISGLDPSGGAGLFADLRGFAAASVWGCGAVAVITVQSTAGLRASYPVPTAQLLGQVRELFAEQNVRSIKIGALGSASNVRGIARWLESDALGIPVVLDPVMRATRSPRKARLLDEAGVRALRGIVELATVITPNVPEAEILWGSPIRTIADAERAALALAAWGPRAALVKGGHLADTHARDTTVDVLAIGRRVFHLRARRKKADFHGTGCALASLIAGKLARGPSKGDAAILDAVRWAKQKLKTSLDRPARVGAGLLVLPL